MTGSYSHAIGKAIDTLKTSAWTERLAALEAETAVAKTVLTELGRLRERGDTTPLGLLGLHLTHLTPERDAFLCQEITRLDTEAQTVSEERDDLREQLDAVTTERDHLQKGNRRLVLQLNDATRRLTGDRAPLNAKHPPCISRLECVVAVLSERRRAWNERERMDPSCQASDPLPIPCLTPKQEILDHLSTASPHPKRVSL